LGGLIHEVVTAGGWCGGFASELHPRYFGWTPCLTLVTHFARTCQIVPGMCASEEARDNMVYGQFPCLFATVQTGVIVSNENLASAQSPLHARPLDHVSKADYRWHRYGNRRTVHDIRVILQNLSLAYPEQHNRPPCPANIERLVILVQDKDRGIYHDALHSAQILAEWLVLCNITGLTLFTA